MDEFIIINNKKYNINSWKKTHPGGDVFKNFIGQDCTAIFNAYHNTDDKNINKILNILNLEKDEKNVITDIDKDYIKLNELFRNKGFYEINQVYYFKKLIWLALLFLGTLYFNGSIDIVSGCLFGLLIQQSAFIGHDIGHNSVLHKTSGVFNSKYKNWWALLFGNILFGVDGLNWSDNHNEHHYMSCVPGKDPQNDHLPFILYKKRELDITGYKLNLANKLLLRLQWLYILPILFTVGKINIMLDIDNRRLITDRQFIRIGGIILHILLWIYLTLNSGNKGYFIACALFFNGMIHLQIILSHACMPRTTMEEIFDNGWVKSQAITTVNIKTSWYDEWFHGGLQYQYDHHLFPKIPRHNLKLIQPYILDFCKKHNITYNTMTFREAIYNLVYSLYIEARKVE